GLSLPNRPLRHLVIYSCFAKSEQYGLLLNLPSNIHLNESLVPGITSRNFPLLNTSTARLSPPFPVDLTPGPSAHTARSLCEDAEFTLAHYGRISNPVPCANPSKSLSRVTRAAPRSKQPWASTASPTRAVRRFRSA